MFMLNCWEFAYPNTVLLTSTIMCHLNETQDQYEQNITKDVRRTAIGQFWYI